MNTPMLAVDSNIEVSRREQIAWLEQGIATVRVDTMQEAIEKLNKEEFFIVAINADNIKYLPLLRVMRDVTHLLVFIVTSNFTSKDQAEALHSGADVFVPFLGSSEENVLSALATIHRFSERSTMPKKPAGLMTYKGLLFYPKFHQVFFRDEEIKLTSIEFDLFHYLISNPDQPLTFRQIFRKVWGKEYDEASHQILWQHMYRLRQKFKAANHEGCIESRRGMGYCFSTRTMK